MRSLALLLLTTATAVAVPWPFAATSGARQTDAVFRRHDRVLYTQGRFTVTDAFGKIVGRGIRGRALPTSRYGTFRVSAPNRPATSYAVIPATRLKAEPRSPFGMGAYFSMRYSREDQRRCAALLVRMGATASRDELNWDIVEPEPGRWTWAKCDAGVNIQHEFGIEPLGLLCYWGRYVNDRPERTGSLLAHSPEAVAAYADYCRRCVARYKPTGTLAKLRLWNDGWGIRHWEVWNEPSTFWNGTPEQFGNLLKAAYKAIKAEDPNAVVHFSNIGAEWDARTLKVAGKSYDGLTPHYYCPPRSPDEAEMDRQMRDTVKWYAARGLKGNLWVSEVGWDTTADRQQEARQAQDLVRAYAMALDAGMDRVFWYNFRDDGGQSANGQIPWYGVVHRDMTPKIAYAAYAAMVERLRGLKPAGRASLGSAVKAILFSRKGGTTAVIWADRHQGSMSLPSRTKWYDSMGNRGSGRIPLNAWPVYVVASGKSAAWLRSRLQSSDTQGIRPVDVRPFQFVRRGSRTLLAVNLRNQSPATARVGLQTPAAPVRVTLAPCEQKGVVIDHRSGDLRFQYWVDALGHKSSVSEDLAGVPHTVIPRGEGEAPTYDQLWALKPQWVMDTAKHNAGILPWSPMDLSAKAQFQYDEAGLWMRFIVTDNVFHQTRTENDIWQEDSVQVGIQADTSKAASAKRHSFGFALTPDGPKAFRYGGPGGWTGTLDVRQRGKETTYDVRIAWPDLAPLKPQPGQGLLMDFMVNDNDGDGRRGWLEWTPGIGTGDDPSRWMEWSLGMPAPPPTNE